ncbi:ATP-binding protein [Bacillus sp. FJAT-27231]|uniref:ATP-binding protein n=1 Tax=Bacillus sp. FJAT-27231 TaxID=1679168 RepID=UPI00069EC6C8|nr:ATP-binding protein [Bacillus sp. FJAT-27231]
MIQNKEEAECINESIKWLNDRIKEMLLIVDKEGKIKYLNFPFEQAVQTSLAELLDQSFLELVHPEDRQRVEDQLFFQQNNVNMHPFIHRCNCKNDAFSVIQWETIERDEQGWIRMIGHPIKDKKWKEETDRGEGEQLLLDGIQNINEVICIYDIEKKQYLYATPSFKEFWGFDIEQSYMDPAVVSKRIRNATPEEIRACFSTPTDTPREMEFELRGEGEEHSRWIKTKIIPIANGEKTASRYICVSCDITKWKEQDRLAEKWDKLGMIGQLAAGIAHEIRNPLTAVKGFVQLLGKETNSQYNEIIVSELERIEFIMNEFLFLAKPQQDMKLETRNMNKLIKEVVNFMKPEALLNDVTIHVRCDSSLPLVCCEPQQIKQVMINLIKNAVEAMPSGGNILIQTAAKSRGYASIEVCDEGIGIPEDKLQKLFEPFYTSKETGTGLGLMVSKKIIEDHKGSLTFSSEVGKGTAALILLPGADDE